MKRGRWALAAAFMLMLVPNVAAALHARATLTFVEEGERTQNPENLGSLEVLATLLTGVRVPKPTSAEPTGKIGELAITEALPG